MSIRPIVIFLIVGAVLLLFVLINRSMYQVFTPKLSSKIHAKVRNTEPLSTQTIQAPMPPPQPPPKPSSTTKLEIYDSEKELQVPSAVAGPDLSDPLKKQISAFALKLFLNEIGASFTSPFEISEYSVSSSEGPTLDFYGTSGESDKELNIKFSKITTADALRNDFLVALDLIGSKLVTLNHSSFYSLEKESSFYLILTKYPRSGASHLFVFRQNSPFRPNQAEAFYRAVAN